MDIETYLLTPVEFRTSHLKMNTPCELDGGVSARKLGSHLGVDVDEKVDINPVPLCGNEQCSNTAHWMFCRPGEKRQVTSQIKRQRLLALLSLPKYAQASVSLLAKTTGVSPTFVRRVMADEGISRKQVVGDDGRVYAANHSSGQWMRQLSDAIARLTAKAEPHRLKTRALALADDINQELKDQ